MISFLIIFFSKTTKFCVHSKVTITINASVSQIRLSYDQPDRRLKRMFDIYFDMRLPVFVAAEKLKGPFSDRLNYSLMTTNELAYW